MDKPLLFNGEDGFYLMQKHFHYLVVFVCMQSDKISDVLQWQFQKAYASK